MTTKTSRSCIIIAGMHRSGTSALSRVIGLLGCTLPKNLLAANPTNSTGHWESERLSYFNDEVLESAGSTWDDWATCSPDWIDSPAMSDFGSRALEMYQEEFGEANLTVLKDPRICRLLPFWLPLFEQAKIATYVIVPIRNPKEVAASLAKRDHSDIHYNQLLWLRHVLEAEAGSRGVKRAFVTYDDLLENYSIVISATEERLGLRWPRRSARTSEEIEAYLSESHRHERLSAKSVYNDLSSSDWLRQTYEIMLRWADSGENAADYDTLDAILADFNVSARRFSRVIYRGKVAMEKLDLSQRVSDEREALIADLNEQLARKSQEYEYEVRSQTDKLVASEAALAGLTGELAIAQEQLSAGAATMQAQQLEHMAMSAAAQTDIQRLTHDASLLQASLVETQQHLQESLAGSEAQLNDIRAEILSAQSRADAALSQLELEKEQGVQVSSQLQADLAAALSQLELEKEQSAQQADKLRADLAVYIVALADAEAKHRNELDLIEQSNARMIKGFKDTFALAEFDNEDLTSKLKEAQLALENLEQTRRTQLFEMNQIRSSLAQKKAEADDYHFEIKRFDAEKAGLKQVIDDLQAEIVASRSQGSKLASQIQEIVTAMDKPSGLPLVPKRFKRARNRTIVSAAGVVDHDWYLKTNPDVSALGVDATLHYVTHGAAEGRSPNREHDGAKNQRNNA